MAYKRKTIDRYDIETNYGYGWEVEDSCYTRQEAVADYREYAALTNHYGGAVRIKKRRERIEQ